MLLSYLPYDSGEAASVVLMGDRLAQVMDALELGSAALGKIHINLAWALCYNLVGIPLAAGEQNHDTQTYVCNSKVCSVIVKPWNQVRLF